MDANRADMIEIVAYFEAELARGATTVELDVLDPDLGSRNGERNFAGESVKIGESYYRHRSFAVWLELAQRLGLRLCTPRPLDAPLLRLRFELLDRAKQIVGGPEGREKYGTATDWGRIHKDEDPGFVIDLKEALERVAPKDHCRVLDLGVNTGYELQLMWRLCRPLMIAKFVGVDHSSSAIDEGREIYLRNNLVELHQSDFASMDSLNLGKFDLVVSFGTFQSAGLDDRDLLRRVVQDYLKPDGSVIIGVPNCRYIDGEVEYGARMKNFSQPELGLVVKDIGFYRKYLQQHHKQVFVTGTHYLLVTAIPATERTRAE